jgi:DNA-binding LacI/PurR family transcriptional regulator
MIHNKTPLGRMSKLQQTCVQLSEMAYRLGAGQKFPTVLQLCEDLSVSPVTLNSALRELEDSDVIYRRHAVGVFVSPNLRRSISLLCSPSFFSRSDVADFWGLLIKNATEHAERSNARLRCDFTTPVEEPISLSSNLQQELLSGEIQGVIGIALEQNVADWISEQGIPLVTYAAFSPYTANFDSWEVVPAGVQALTEQGCRNIQLWMTEVTSVQTEHKRKVIEQLEQVLSQHHVRGQLEPLSEGLVAKRFIGTNS